MNIVQRSGMEYLVHLSLEELNGVNNALNEVCNGIHIEDAEFSTRLGASREALRSLLESIHTVIYTPSGEHELIQTSEDRGSVQVRCISAHGDPVDMNAEEARRFAEQIITCADEADK
jgi:hypothetical protein